MENIIENILNIEWDMFYSTQNLGGQASCQQDKNRFIIMRKAQFLGWDEKSLNCYLEDLEHAYELGANLVTLKYAYMMKSTDPEGYKVMEHRLPAISSEKEKIVEGLVDITIEWCIDFAARYPRIASMGRVLRSSEDTLFSTSVETYSRGELSSYGLSTLEALKMHYEALRKEGINLHEQTVEREMHLMGVGELADIEKRLNS